DVLLQAYAGGSDLAGEQNHRPLDRVPDRNDLRMTGLALARKRLQVAGDAGHALGKVGDQVEIAGDLPEIATLSENLRARHERANGGERLIDLVRDRRRHLPERREL